MRKKKADTQQIAALTGGAMIALGVAGWSISRSLNPPAAHDTPPPAPAAPGTTPGTAGAAKPIAGKTAQADAISPAAGAENDPFVQLPPAQKDAVAPAAPPAVARVAQKQAAPPRLVNPVTAPAWPPQREILTPIHTAVVTVPPRPVLAPPPPLSGTLLGAEPSAVFQVDSRLVVVPVGGVIDSWRVIAVGEGQATLRHASIIRQVGNASFDSGSDASPAPAAGGSVSMAGGATVLPEGSTSLAASSPIASPETPVAPPTQSIEARYAFYRAHHRRAPRWLRIAYRKSVRASRHHHAPLRPSLPEPQRQPAPEAQPALEAQRAQPTPAVARQVATVTVPRSAVRLVSYQPAVAAEPPALDLTLDPTQYPDNERRISDALRGAGMQPDQVTNVLLAVGQVAQILQTTAESHCLIWIHSTSIAVELRDPTPGRSPEAMSRALLEARAGYTPLAQLVDNSMASVTGRGAVVRLEKSLVSVSQTAAQTPVPVQTPTSTAATPSGPGQP